MHNVNLNIRPQQFCYKRTNGLPNHQPIKHLGYSRCTGHRDNQEPITPGLSDIMLCTKLGPLPGSHRHRVTFILLPPTGTPWLQAHWLGEFPGSFGRTNSLRSGIEQRDAYRHVRWEILRRRSEGSGSVYSQALPAWRPTALDSGRYSGSITLEKPAAEAVADHQGPRSESRGEPPAEVGVPPAQIVEERPVQRDTRMPRSWGPVAVEDDQAADEISYSISP